MSLTGLVFLFAYFGGCLVSLAWHPIVGLATYVGVFYLHPPSRWWGVGLPSVRWALVAAVVTLVSVWVHDQKLPRRGRFFESAPAWAMLGMILWLGLQLLWAVWPDTQLDLLELYAKYLILMYVMFRILQSEREIKLFLWAHVLGCFFLGWTAYETHTGGRFEGFGGADIGEANAGALTLATGAFAVGVLFLAGKWKERIPLLLMSPFILDGIIRTVSRSASLALASGGLAFNLYTPGAYRRLVRWLSVLAAVLFLILTNSIYWSRLDTVTAMGAEVEGVDTGSGRLTIMAAQIRMFKANPFGSGHRATAYSSPLYLPDEVLTQVGEERRRSSHNTFLSFLVEQGVVGAFFYIGLLVWVLKRLLSLRRILRRSDGFGAMLLPGVAAVMISIYVGDLFVDYLKYEVRFWFLALIMVMVQIWGRERIISAEFSEDKAMVPVDSPETAFPQLAGRGNGASQ